MYRHESPSSKENRPPLHSPCHTTPSARLRQPLGRHKACNVPRDAVADADAWLKRSHAALTSKHQHGGRSPGRASAAAPPAAQPSASPDIIRKKASREMPVAEGCFGIGPTVQGNVKDRRKSKPRALLTVEPFPHSGERQTQGLPKPGRASLEWISDDADSELEADVTSTDGGSSGDGSLCPGFQRLQEWNALRGSSNNYLPSLIRKLDELKLEFSSQDQPGITVSSLCCSFREEARTVRPKSEVRLAAFLQASTAVKVGDSSAVVRKQVA